jgi:hypothetical protein
VEIKVKVVQIELLLNRADASALRAVLDEYVKAIRYLENNQPQNLPEHFDRERDAIVTTLTAVENALHAAPEVIDGIGELIRRGAAEIRLGPAPAFTLAAPAMTEHRWRRGTRRRAFRMTTNSIGLSAAAGEDRQTSK